MMGYKKLVIASAARQPRTLQSCKKGSPSALAAVHGVRLPRSYLARNDIGAEAGDAMHRAPTKKFISKASCASPLL